MVGADTYDVREATEVNHDYFEQGETCVLKFQNIQFLYLTSGINSLFKDIEKGLNFSG